MIWVMLAVSVLLVIGSFVLDVWLDAGGDVATIGALIFGIIAFALLLVAIVLVVDV